MTPLIALWNEFIQIWSVHFIRLTTAITKCWNDGKWFKRNQGWAMGVVAVFGEGQANSSIDFDTALPVRTDMQVIINGSVRCHSLSFLSTHNITSNSFIHDFIVLNFFLKKSLKNTKFIGNNFSYYSQVEWIIWDQSDHPGRFWGSVSSLVTQTAARFRYKTPPKVIITSPAFLVTSSWKNSNVKLIKLF